MSPQRSAGSVAEFESDWSEALRGGGGSWFAYPDPGRGEQVALVEWVKAQQILLGLAMRGIERGRVLEYGCGSAGMSVYLKERGYETYAMDLSPSALEVARLNDARHSTVDRSLTLVAADTLALPVRDGAFDIAMSNGLLEHFDDRALDRLLAEVVRSLRPGGVFVADIVPRRLNARTAGNVVNLAASSAYHLARGDLARVRELPRRYFAPYFETSHGPDTWERILRQHGLEHVSVQVCRPFPMLAITGAAERAYVRLLRSLLPLWLRFDRSHSWLARQWGWMYLAWGRRPER